MANVLEFANFTLVFGTKGVMADFLDQIVIPAFSDKTLTRPFGETTFLFRDVAIVNLGTTKKPEPAIVGTFIKDTVARREQILNRETGQLEKSPRKWQTSPSVTFGLVLATHKLLYLRETSEAPGFDAFRSTVQKFLIRKYFAFIDQEYARRQPKPSDTGKIRVTKKALREEFDPPLLSVVPLQSKQGLAASVEKFKTLQLVKVEMEAVNAESHNDPFFVKFRQEKDAVGAKKATLIEENKDGLNKNAVTTQLGSLAQEGMASVFLKGITPDDKQFEVDDDDLRLRIQMANLPPTVPEKAQVAYNEFQKVITDNTLVLGQIDESEANIIRRNSGSNAAIRLINPHGKNHLLGNMDPSEENPPKQIQQGNVVPYGVDAIRICNFLETIST